MDEPPQRIAPAPSLQPAAEGDRQPLKLMRYRSDVGGVRPERAAPYQQGPPRGAPWRVGPAGRATDPAPGRQRGGPAVKGPPMLPSPHQTTSKVYDKTDRKIFSFEKNRSGKGVGPAAAVDQLRPSKGRGETKLRWVRPPPTCGKTCGKSLTRAHIDSTMYAGGVQNDSTDTRFL